MKVGDKVQAIDDDFEGVISAIHGEDIDVVDDDGFTIIYHSKELILNVNSNMHKSNIQVPKSAILEKENFNKKASIKVSSKKRNEPTMEVDLHIHKLVERSARLSNYEMLNLQIDHAKRQLDFAISKRLSKMVFIHGVGEGVLKEELHTLLRRYDNLKFYDANFQKYGVGATEVYIYQSSTGVN